MYVKKGGIWEEWGYYYLISFFPVAISLGLSPHFSFSLPHSSPPLLLPPPSTDSPYVPCMCFTGSQKVAKQLIIHRGLHPIVIPDGHLWQTNKNVVLDHAKRLGFVTEGDRVVVLTGELITEGSTSTSGTYFMDVK